ncbi:hypothetical protein J4573_46315 [Actinomadura barringtoniae]|uniref:SnoaL-like domain-containing protein n=1 Tax=Actinomadura barringtoniae TaxID=1427535 RepID=A0A939PKF9_9ACTN|nr:hypothetical protein [Actinomadura barringtoniae]MBO2454572.1 hypothetical protein [Actinomadura barringtoniae]
MHEVGVRVFDDWTALWNRDLTLAEKIMAPEIRLRYAQPGSDAFDTIRHPKQLAERIDQFHETRPNLRYKAEGEAVVNLTMSDGGPTGLVTRPYLARHDYDGKPHAISGIDMLRLENGLIVEVWSVSGGLAGRAFYND